MTSKRDPHASAVNTFKEKMNSPTVPCKPTLCPMIKRTLSFLLSLVALTLTTQAAEPSHPNVIFVLADDLGIGDVSPTNPDCKIKTPHLQAMADEGITFFDAHSSSSVCTPTRYGVLTGRYN